MSSCGSPDCNMMWIGDRLGAVERACMRSVLCQGHNLVLYCYEEPSGVPAGVKLKDASNILPREAIIRHSTGSLALFSDRFRFELQRRAAGIWLDADVYLVAPLEVPRCGHMFGWDPTGVLGTAVLHLPADSPIIAEVLSLFEHPRVPHWLSLRCRLRAWGRQVLTGTCDLARLPWGAAGPLALTALAREFELVHLAAPSATYYPVGYTEASWIFDPSESLADRVLAETRAIHLFNYMIAGRKDAPARDGSFLARLQEEGL